MYNGHRQVKRHVNYDVPQEEAPRRRDLQASRLLDQPG